MSLCIPPLSRLEIAARSARRLKLIDILPIEHFDQIYFSKLSNFVTRVDLKSNEGSSSICYSGNLAHDQNDDPSFVWTGNMIRIRQWNDRGDAHRLTGPARIVDVERGRESIWAVYGESLPFFEAYATKTKYLDYLMHEARLHTSDCENTMKIAVANNWITEEGARTALLALEAIR